ncbi:FixH family protein [Sphingomonas canadensis]|uniref:FixH family protein n=1 Tax=Sphingomonas canadensis TaxID=1219257 RepID=A0ABW3H924_9SPHN|nr:FixH family protein [Sphingomonas canadensis]MCW3835621.1 FixH family protein [Sphingomonas canadensis]
MTRRFTGWHMLACMVGFFGVVIAVNVAMATLAARTFGGTVVKNSYVASQQFNTWLAEADAQQKLGWKAEAEAIDGRLVIGAQSATAPLTGARVTAVAMHPLGRAADIPLAFNEAEPGRFVAATRLPAGRWRVRIRIERDGRAADYLRDVAA